VKALKAAVRHTMTLAIVRWAMSHADSQLGRRSPYLRLPSLVTVWLGGACGTASRYGITLLMGQRSFPWATFLINVTGAFLLGLLLEGLSRRVPDGGRRRMVRLFAGTGFLGGFTTYSALASDAVRLLQSGQSSAAAAYALGTMLTGGVASLVGIVTGAHLRRREQP
jgi:CrcB protein